MRKLYLWFIAILFLTPNLFIIVTGIESFPFTCAPMFSHYIDDSTELYSLKFEGIDANGDKTDLLKYYGKSEVAFERHFFSKAFGSVEPKNPFSHRLTDNRLFFNKRLKLFFNHYNSFLLEKHNLSYNEILVSAISMNPKTKKASRSYKIGFFDSTKKEFYFAK